jgi:hypothetical protein
LQFKFPQFGNANIGVGFCLAWPPH